MALVSYKSLALAASSMQLSGVRHARYSGFAAVGPAARRYRSIAAGPASRRSAAVAVQQ